MSLLGSCHTICHDMFYAFIDIYDVEVHVDAMMYD